MLGCGLRRGEVAGPHAAITSNNGGALGDRRPDRQGGAHPHGAGAGLGEVGGGRVDDGSADQGTGPLFRCVSRRGSVWGDGITEKVIWHVVKAAAATAGIAKLSPHDCRRTCARLCHAAGGELEQIQFLLGHVSVETTERYLGCKQRLRGAVNDQIGLEP